MAAIKVFRCPSCGASLSTDGEEAQLTCQFCGTTVIVPAELRSRPQPPAPAARPYPPQAAVPPPPFVPAGSVGRRSSGGRLAIAIILFVFVCIALSSIIPVIAGLLPLAIGVAPAVTAISGLSTPLALATALPAATPTPEFAQLVLEFGGEGAGEGRFDDPRAIDVDGQGNVFVGEYSRGRVQKFDSTGVFLAGWTAAAPFDSAPLRGLAADRAGNVYVARGGRIAKHDGATGELLAVFEDEHGYDDVVMLPGGGLLACSCFGADDLVFVDEQGAQLNRIAKAVTGLTGDPVSNLRLAVDGLGNIFVLSSKHNAVFHFDPSGRFIDRFGAEGDEPGQFSAPGVIAVDSRGRVYVSDFRGIQVFTAEGQYLDVFDGPGGFILGLAFSDQDELYAASNSDQVFKFVLAQP